MSAVAPLRKRKSSRIAPGLDPTQFPLISNKAPFEWTHEIRHSPWDSFKFSLWHFQVNFWPNIRYFMNEHPLLIQVLNYIAISIAVAFIIVVSFFRAALEPRFTSISPWHVELHNAWLRDHDIRESTWILDEDAQAHTSNDPSLVDEVLLQFPQRNGGASIQLRDVRFDDKAHYGVISMPKLEEDHVPMRTLFGVGEGTRPVMGVEVIGRDIVAIAWGGKGTYILKAWTLRRCEEGHFFPILLRPYCYLQAFWNWNSRRDIPAETMRELVDKHRVVPTTDADKDEAEREEATVEFQPSRLTSHLLFLYIRTTYTPKQSIKFLTTQQS